MYGIAAVAIIIILENLKVEDVRWAFLISLLISGLIEYFTSLLLEKVFGISFWDYSRIKPNIHGRVNLWYLMLFGVIGVGWWKLYSFILENFNFDFSKVVIIISLMAFVFYCLDFIMTGIILLRFKDRRKGIFPRNHFESWLDLKYSDKKLVEIFSHLEVLDKVIIE